MAAEAAILVSREPEISIVTGKSRICYLLMRLIETRAPLTLTFADSQDPGTSLLLQLDFKSGEMTLDQPYPPRAVQAGQTAKLHGRVEGSVVEFEAEVLREISFNGMGALRVSVPARITHSERRGSFRVHIPSDMYLPPTTFTTRAGAFRGRLLDVSDQGAGSVVAAKDVNDVGRVLACALSLPGTRLISDVEICSIAAEAGARRLGFRFAGLNAAQQSAISRAVLSLDRQLLRRYASAAWV